MVDPNDPPRGSMYLYDDITPPTADGVYKMTVSTDITFDSTQSAPLERHFEVVGPRFTLDPTMVAGVFPPRNGQGTFQDALPMITLKQRTLPWERTMGSAAVPNGPNGQVPWVALLLFEEGEYTLLTGQKLEDVVPSSVFAALGSPRNILCDAIEADAQLVQDILPSVEELQLLAHVRQVNVEDRELNAGSSDGFFSVVMTNRLPAPNTKCRACLVSLERRTDLVQTKPPPFVYSGSEFGIIQGGIPILTTGSAGTTALAPPAPLVGPVVGPVNFPIVRPGPIFFRPLTRLVLLHSWAFTVTGPGKFRTLMQNLNVAMIGTVKETGKPALTDTGHLRLPVLDRAGETEVGWYRGPLVPWELTRDSLGPYHSADQCRRATPETGAEDVSYAAAFEVGRQLAAADPRLAVELMRWRRESYKQSARADVIDRVQNAVALNLPPTLPEKLRVPLPLATSVSAATAIVNGAPEIADRFGLNSASMTQGMDPAALAQAWQLSSTAQAQAILGGDPATYGATVAAPAQTPRPNTTINEVAGDTASLNRLKAARDRLLANVLVQLGGGK
jgi:hypothetical protein